MNEPRKLGRPPLPVEQRQQVIRVKLPPDLYDAVCRTSLRRDVAVNAIVRSLIKDAHETGELD
jgi:hypothetical protein